MAEKRLTFPVPQPDRERYQAMFERGFERFPARKENWRRDHAPGKTEQLDYWPVKADIENVSRCNFRCGHCLVSTLDGKSRAKDLSIDDFKAFIDEQVGLVEIKMQGLGEPFMQRAFVDMVSYAAERDIWVRTTTNGSLLHKRDNYRRIIEAGVGEIQVSIDGATKVTQEKIRVRSDFDQIVHNCRLLNEFCADNGRDDTRMWTVLQEENIDEAEQLLELARHMGFKRLTLSVELREWEGQEGLNERIRQNRVGQTITQQWLDGLLGKAQERGIDLTFWHATDRFSRQRICFWPFERFLLSSEGEVVPCCIIADPAVYSFGSYRDFASLWKGPQMAAFRRVHIEGGVPEMCKACYA